MHFNTFNWIPLILFIICLHAKQSLSSDDNDENDINEKPNYDYFNSYKDKPNRLSSSHSRDFEFDEKKAKINNEDKSYDSWLVPIGVQLCRDIKCKENERCLIKNNTIAICQKVETIEEQPVSNKKKSKINKQKWQNYYEKMAKLRKNKLQNSVLPINEPKLVKKVKSTCNDNDFKVLQSRLLDWFTVVLADQKKKYIKTKGKKITSDFPDCSFGVAWMFHHLDNNQDLKLSHKELYYLEHDQEEKCLKAYLYYCDEDNDGNLSPYEWCSCFDKKSKPCSSVTHRIKKGLIGAYIPQCDEEGFFTKLQCHSSTGQCWCVDKYGVEFANTRRKGFPDCTRLIDAARERLDGDDDNDDDNDDEGDDDDLDGSGDREI